VVEASNRWWTYQRERFPLVANGLLIAVFSLSAVSFSAMLLGRWLSWPSLAVAFPTSLAFFMQLRIADEFKDFDDDSRYRPYRPVPRGLVKLRELGWIGIGLGIMQLALALWLRPGLVVLLVATWAYLGLMSAEFFVGGWLKAHPFTYLWSHMLIMPLIDLYATATYWLPAAGRPPAGLAWFLALSFFNGVVIEVGRKLRAPEDEETGVETYTFLYGRTKAVALWLAAMALTAAGAVMAGAQIGFAGPVAAILGALLVVAAWVAIRFLRQPVHARSRWFEPMSGAWALVLYLSLGALPLLMRL
jgi:hypothetical protein